MVCLRPSPRFPPYSRHRRTCRSVGRVEVTGESLSDTSAGLSTLPLAAISSTLTALEANKNGDNLGPQGAQALDKAGYESVSSRAVEPGPQGLIFGPRFGGCGIVRGIDLRLTDRRTAARRCTSMSPTTARPKHGTGNSTSLPWVGRTFLPADARRESALTPRRLGRVPAHAARL